MAGVGMPDVYTAPAVRVSGWKPSWYYRSKKYKGKLYEPIRLRKSCMIPKKYCGPMLHLEATRPREEMIDKPQ